MCMWWDVQCWTSCHVRGKFSKVKLRLVISGTVRPGLLSLAPGTSVMSLLANSLIHSLSSDPKNKREFLTEEKLRQPPHSRCLTLDGEPPGMTLALGPLTPRACSHTHLGDMLPGPAGGLWAGPTRLSGCRCFAPRT